MSQEHDLTHVLTLLDDPDTNVQSAIQSFLRQYKGNLLEDLQHYAKTLSPRQKHLLSQSLATRRQTSLTAQWSVPHSLHQSEQKDWDTFEFLLSLLSDFIYDGITNRPTLPDQLDQLATKIQRQFPNPTVEQLRRHLYASGQFRGNTTQFFAKQNSDLVWVLSKQVGSPISLSILFILIANRLDLEVEGCNYPGHFLSWVPSSKKDYLIDPYNRGRILHPELILNTHPHLTKKARKALSAPCTLTTILIRLINNIETSLVKSKHLQQAPILQALRSSLQKTGAP